MAQIRKICDGCKKPYWSPGADWQHRSCGTAQIGIESDIGVRTEVIGGGSTVASMHKEVSIRGSIPGRKQRWAKDKYNAYMREYMKRYRAKIKAQEA